MEEVSLSKYTSIDGKKYLRLIGKMSMRDTLENMCSGKQPSRSYSNQNQTEDFGLKFYDVVGN